ncbi:MAG: polysaccharide biosynthesis C-terminal domain-containing protein, partial [Thermoplasmata archaeon]
ISLVPYYFLSNMVTVPKSYYSSRISPYRIVLPSIAEAVLRNSIFIVIAILFAFKMVRFIDDDVAIVIALTYTVSYSVYFGFLMRLGHPWKIGKPSRDVFRYFLGIALPLAASAGIGTINGNIDKVIMQFFWHADATSALYTSQIVASALFSFSGAISGFFLPLLSRKEKIFDGNYSVQEMERFISLFILPFVLVFAVLSRYILNIFNAGYLEYGMILSISAFAVYFSIITGPYSSSIIARGKSMIIAKITTPSIVVNILLNFLLVPASIFGITYFSAGPEGTVLASLIVAISDYIIYKIVSLRMTEEYKDLRMIRQIIPAAVEIIFLMIVVHYIKPYSIFLLVPTALLGSLIFFFIAMAVKELTMEEFVTFIKNLNPLNIGKNIRLEREEDNKK